MNATPKKELIPLLCFNVKAMSAATYFVAPSSDMVEIMDFVRRKIPPNAIIEKIEIHLEIATIVFEIRWP